MHFVGDSVTLPCLYENKQSDVFWRYNKNRNVLSIKNDKLSLEDQDTIFQNRAESFPSEYAKGNYSVMLKNVQLIHAGNYSCLIVKSDEEKNLQLFVKGKLNLTAIIAAFYLYTTLMNLQNCFSLHYIFFLTEKSEKNIQEPGNSCMEVQSQKILTFLIALLGLTLHLI